MLIFFVFSVGVFGFVVNLVCLVGILDNIVNFSIFGYKWVNIDFESIVIGDSCGVVCYIVGGVYVLISCDISICGNLVGISNVLDIVLIGWGMLFVISVNQFDVVCGGDVLLMMIWMGVFCVDEEGVLWMELGFVLMGWFVDQNGNILNVVCDLIVGLQLIVLNVNDIYVQLIIWIEVGFNLLVEVMVGGGVVMFLIMMIQYFDNLGVLCNLIMFFMLIVGVVGMGWLNSWMVQMWDLVIVDDVGMFVDELLIGFYELIFDDVFGGLFGLVIMLLGGVYDVLIGDLIINVVYGLIIINIGQIGIINGLIQISVDFLFMNLMKNGVQVGVMVGVEIDE